MRLRYEKVESLPRLAWCAALRRGSDELVVRHGPWVETRASGFVEGVWDGPFTGSHPDEAVLMAGTAGRVTATSAVFTTATNPFARVFVQRAGDILRVSNSLVFLLVEAGDAPDPRHPYYTADFRLAAQCGIRRADRAIHTRDGAVLQFECCILAVDAELDLRRIEKPAPAVPGDYSEYLQLLDGAIARAFANARDPERTRRFEPFVALSRGYDSPAVAVLAREHGCTEAFTLLRAGESGDDDDGSVIAGRLGLESRAVRLRGVPAGQGLVEPEFVVCPPGANVSFAAWGEHVSGRLFVRGTNGDRILATNRAAMFPDLACNLGWPDWSGSEFRLRAGFLDFTPLFVGWQHDAQIHRISMSPEMRPWSVGGTYDRPIARRIVEGAGIPRADFAREKMVPVYHWMIRVDQLSPAGQADYREFVRALQLPPSFFLKVRSRHWLHRSSMRWSGLGVPGTELHVGRKCSDPRRTGFVFHWGFDRIRQRYAAGGLAGPPDDGSGF
jgi:hypothetical protein